MQAPRFSFARSLFCLLFAELKSCALFTLLSCHFLSSDLFFVLCLCTLQHELRSRIASWIVSIVVALIEHCCSARRSLVREG